jgi:site-specific DNA-cytosine methylase
MNENKDKIILDLCGGTGSWSRPYVETGYDVKLITLPKYDVTKVHFGETTLMFRGNPQIVIPYWDVWGILAAPPCTEFSLAKSTKPRDFVKGMRIVQSCVQIIWHCRMSGGLKWWAMENPRGFLRQFMGKPAFRFEQWEFGHKGVKPTDIWGYFIEPKKKVKIKPEGLSKYYPSGSRNALGWSKTAVERAITPAGFAKAFYEANK